MKNLTDSNILDLALNHLLGGNPLYYLACATIALFIFALYPNRPILNLIGHYGLKLIWVGMLALAAFFILLPIFRPLPDTGGMIIFLSVPILLISIIPYLMYTFAHNLRAMRGLTPAQKLEKTIEIRDKMHESLQKEIARDTKKVNKFWISSSKRKDLRENIGHSKFLLQGMDALVESAREEAEKFETNDTTAPLLKIQSESSEENLHPSLRRRDKPPEK